MFESLTDDEKLIAVLVSRHKGKGRKVILSTANEKITTRRAIQAFRDLHQKGLIFRKPASKVWESIIEVPRYLHLPKEPK